jgi:hypothetical protein
MLIPNQEGSSGCKVNIPEIVLFESGKPKMFLKNDKDGRVVWH